MSSTIAITGVQEFWARKTYETRMSVQKGAFGIRRERLRNSLNVYPAEKRRKSSNVYLFRNPARNIKQVSSKRNWKGLSKHGTPKYMCYIRENLTVAQLPTHTHTHSCRPEGAKHSIAIYHSIADLHLGRRFVPDEYNIGRQIFRSLLKFRVIFISLT